MTGPRVTWEVANESGSYTVLINDTYYKYTYHKPNSYTEYREKRSYVFGGALFNGVNDYVVVISDYPSYNNSAIYKRNITNDFINNRVAISNFLDIGNVSGYFIGNGNAIYQYGGRGTISGAFINNSYRAITESSHGSAGDISGNFIGNYVVSSDGIARGGAIYADTYGSYGKLNVIANSGNQIIYKDDAGNDIEESNAIHINNGTLNLSACSGGQIIFDDKITAKEGTINTAFPDIINNYINLEGTFCR